jgi:HEPN domain-containing protein
MRIAVESFIALAREDLAVAKKLVFDHPRHAAFNIEQAAEKLLKAVLSTEGITFNAGHQLGALAAMLPAGHIWRADLATFDDFTSYATAVRYPTGSGRMPQEPDAADLHEGLKRVAMLLDEIEDWCRNPRSS